MRKTTKHQPIRKHPYTSKLLKPALSFTLMLLQYCSRYDCDASPEELDEAFDLTLDCIQEEDIAVLRREKTPLTEPLEGIWQLVGFKTDEGRTGVLTRVRAQLCTSDPGIHTNLGVGNHGRGRSVDTYELEAGHELSETLEQHIDSIYNQFGGCGYEKTTVQTYLEKARQAYSPVARESFLLMALELEIAKGPLSKPELLDQILALSGENFKYLTSFRGFTQSLITDTLPFYTNAFKKRTKLLKKD